MSQNFFKKTLFEPITVCCWPTILVTIAPNRRCFTFGPPLAARNTSKVASGEGGPKCLNICSANHFLSQSRCVAGPELWSKLLQNEASSLLGPPFRPEIRRRLPLGFSWAALGLLLAAPGLLLAAPGLLLAPPGLLLTHTSIRTSRLEGRRAGRCILRRRDSRCVVSERHRAGVLGLGSPMHGELSRPASPHEVGEGALTAVCPRRW